MNTWNQFDAAVPFGGYKLSGIGREHGLEVLDHYTQVSVLSWWHESQPVVHACGAAWCQLCNSMFRVALSFNGLDFTV